MVFHFGGGFGANGAATGTIIKFNPVPGVDILVENNGVMTNIQTKHHCITCMREYDSKSLLEELRFEDYLLANRKGSGGGFGAGSAATGTTIKFNPVTSTDISEENGVKTNIRTKHHCITCMREYESKSLEELRFEDYLANRKGSGGGFGAGSAATGTTIKFNPVTSTDISEENGVKTNIRTKHHCITCMREYKSKSLEELRFEDYLANRKGPSQVRGYFGAERAPTGTTIKFNPPTDREPFVKNNGETINIAIKRHCITCMREYESKSLEELRFEDYVANRKGPPQGAHAGTEMLGIPRSTIFHLYP